MKSANSHPEEYFKVKFPRRQKGLKIYVFFPSSQHFTKTVPMAFTVTTGGRQFSLANW
jgi:hypothetical protein